jgi:hypothetical protein
MDQRDGASSTPVMYLSHEDWSRRYESSFFTVKLDSVEQLREAPRMDPRITGKTNHPAYYYRVDVFCAHNTCSVFRRYSHFKWLFHQLCASPPSQGRWEEPLIMPPGSCFFMPPDEKFAENRAEQLHEFMRDLLQRPGYSMHPAVVLFLELDTMAS